MWPAAEGQARHAWGPVLQFLLSPADSGLNGAPESSRSVLPGFQPLCSPRGPLALTPPAIRALETQHRTNTALQKCLYYKCGLM